MKTLFVGNPLSQPTDGGGDTFQRLLLAGLQRMRGVHECSYVQPEPNKGVVQALVSRHQFDFVWFLSPYYEPVEVPFAATVWDLGHRQLPWFPELSVQGWSFEEREKHYRHVLPRASLIVTGNATSARAISYCYQVAPDQILQIALPVDAVALAEVRADPAAIAPLGLTGGQYLFYPAQFWPHKNHITLVDMLGAAGMAQPFKLVFSGSDKGNRAHVEDYVAQRGLRERVVFAGFVDNALLRQLYAQAHALVYGSLLGPDNLPPLEAMALRCPVVCAAYEGAREQLGDAALLFDPLDAGEAAAAVTSLTEPALRQRLVEAGLQLVRSRTPDAYVARISAALDRFARRRRLWGAGSSYVHPS